MSNVNKAVPVFEPGYFAPGAEVGGPEFLIIGLPGIDLADVKIERVDGIPRFTGESCRHLLRKGLKGWRGFQDAAGRPVEWGPDLEQNIRRLSLETVVSLAVEIFSRSKLSDDERKNSGSPQTSPRREPISSAAGADGGGIATK
jgi:hypothetical protein